MTRVVHFSSVHRCSDNRIHLREAASLAAAGHDVHLVAVDHDVLIPDTGVRIHRLPVRKRARRMLIGVPHGFAVTLRTRAAIVHLHDPELIPLIPLFRALGKTVIYDAHEDFARQLQKKPYIPAPIMPIARMLAHMLIRFAGFSSSAIVAATETVAKGFPASKTHVVHNYPRIRASDQISHPWHERENKCLYIGALSESRGALDMVDAISASSFPDGWTIDIAGELQPNTLHHEMELRPGWNLTNYHGLISLTAARDLLTSGKVGLVVLHETPAYRDAYPTKLFEYMAAGLPVIASDFPLWRALVVDNNAGTMVDPGQPDQIANAVREYADNPELAEEHGRNGKVAVEEKYNWDVAAQVLADLYAGFS